MILQEFIEKNKIRIVLFENETDYDFYFVGDKCRRYIFKLKLYCGKKSMTIKYGQSIAKKHNPPTIEDILECITINDPENFESFCDNYGYSNDSISAEKMYKAVLKEYKQVIRTFSDCMEELLLVDPTI